MQTRRSKPGGDPVGPRAVSQRGAAAVELALVLPVLTVFLLGVVELGYAFFVQASVASAARVGVRSYAINHASAGAQATAVTVAAAGLPDPGALAGATFSGVCSAGAQTTLTLTYRYTSLTGLLDQLVGPRLTVTGIGSMRCGG